MNGLLQTVSGGKVRIPTDHLLGLLRKATLGSAASDLLANQASQIADKLIQNVTPKLESALAQAAEKASPAIRQVIQEEVAPKIAMGLAAGVAIGGVISGLVGAWFASRGRR